MARRVKITLADDNDYEFSTLTLSQQRAMRKSMTKADKNSEEYDKIAEKVSQSELLSEEEEEKLDEFETKRVHQMLEIVRMSLVKKHDEFKPNDETSKEDIYEKMEDLLDMPTIQQVSSFAMTGTIPKNLEEEYDIKELIDLTESKED